ncbi:MAG: UvrD-helicase domain-containing protein [Gemmatimonadetes bacterium]|nr:UvrD-helicase domain-containing protein [Gemmatimonadota bacterium]
MRDSGFQAPPRELILASAGSGKTYYLSSRILGLLAMGVPPGEVLATTFTRKAAGEILERVLLRLAEGASDPAKARELGRDAHPSLTRPEECRGLLGRLLGNLHQMNVGTLDAFFIRVARSFFLELGLPPRWTIADEPTQDRIRTEAVLVAIAEADRAQLVELLRMLNRDAAHRQVHASLLEKVDSLLAIRRQLDPRAADPWAPDFGVTEQLSPDTLRDNAQALATRLLELEVPSTQRGDPMKQWVTARSNASEAISRLDWDAAFGTGIGTKVLAEEDSFSSKTIPPEFVESFREAIRLARIDLAPKLRREARALGRLAELLEAAFDKVQRRVGAYRFDDITYLLGGPDPSGNREDLGYRLDQRIRHLLLDEFQDTSLEQWRALQPLAHELLSGHLDERAGVIVADPKQSIYGWRGARPELVHQVGEAYGLARATLDTSWRSSPVILDFVSDVFRDLPTNPAIADIDVGPRVASAWMEDFTELAAARELPGHVCVHLAPPAPGGGKGAIRPSLLRRAAQIVKRLHEQIPGRSIGVLASRNRVVGYLMDELRAAGVRASGEGASYLTDTAPANAILSLLRLADHPSDPSALYHVALTPLGELVGLRDREDMGAARALASRIRIQLLADGYGRTLGKWVHGLAPSCDAMQVQRLLQLVELGHRWDERATLRPTDFTRYVASESVEDPSSARVQVMTIHQSKGLEFDAVVLPELYASLAPERGEALIPKRDADTGRVVQVYPGMSKEKLALFPEADVADQELRSADLRDRISVLYVALTRAKYALHLILPPEGGTRKHGAGLIREALLLEDAKATDTEVLMERGDPLWFDRLEGAVEQTDDETPLKAGDETPLKVGDERPREEGEPSPPLFRPSTSGPGRNLARRSPASLEGGTHVDLSFALRLDAASGLRRGQVVHAWCETIGWIEDGVVDDDVLRAIAQEKAPGMNRDQVGSLIGEFRGWLQAEPIRNVLSRGAHPSEPGTSVRVENELPFVRRMADEIQEGFIDRLVLIERDGQVIEADILDFKTDAIETDDQETVAARTEYYRPQIAAYRSVVREQYGLAESDVSGKLVFLAAGVVRKVAGG